MPHAMGLHRAEPERGGHGVKLARNEAKNRAQREGAGESPLFQLGGRAPTQRGDRVEDLVDGATGRSDRRKWSSLHGAGAVGADEAVEASGIGLDRPDRPGHQPDAVAVGGPGPRKRILDQSRAARIEEDVP